MRTELGRYSALAGDDPPSPGTRFNPGFIKAACSSFRHAADAQAGDFGKGWIPLWLRRKMLRGPDRGNGAYDGAETDFPREKVRSQDQSRRGGCLSAASFKDAGKASSPQRGQRT